MKYDLKHLAYIIICCLSNENKLKQQLVCTLRNDDTIKIAANRNHGK